MRALFRHTLVILLVTPMYGAIGETASNELFGTPRFTGSGCRRGTTSYLAVEDSFTILFSDYTVSSAGETPRGSSRYRSCRIEVPLNVPKGKMASVESIDYRGFVNVETGATGYLWGWFQLGREEFGGGNFTRFVGPHEEDFFRRDTVRFRRNSRCARKVSLIIYNFLLLASSHKSRGLITLDSLDGELALNVRLKPCRR